MITWLKRWIWALLAIVGLVGAWLLRRRLDGVKAAGSALGQARHEAEVQRIAVEQSKEAALAAVETRYNAQRAALNDAQKSQAEALRNDPIALGRFLSTVASG